MARFARKHAVVHARAVCKVRGGVECGNVKPAVLPLRVGITFFDFCDRFVERAFKSVPETHAVDVNVIVPVHFRGLYDDIAVRSGNIRRRQFRAQYGGIHAVRIRRLVP